MALTKGTGTSVIASTASTYTSSAIDSSANYLTELYCSIVQSGGAATVAATIQVQVSYDGTNYISPPTLLWTAGLAAATYATVLLVPTTAIKYKLTFTQCTTNTSTCVVVANQVTGV